MKTKPSHASHYLLEGASVLLLLLLVVALGSLQVTRPPAYFQSGASTQEETVQGQVTAVLQEETTQDESGLTQISQILEVTLLSGGHKGETVEITYNGLGPTLRDVRFKPGERALIMITQRPDGQLFFAVADHVRLFPLSVLALLFALVTILIGRWQGFRALIGLGLSIGLISGFILPEILANRDPVIASIVGMAVLMAVTLYLIQGWNAIAHTALLGILASLAVTGAMAVIWTSLTHLTGFGSEETLYLQATGVTLNMQGLLLAGIIVGAAGVLDDVVLAQAVTAFELVAANPALHFRELYQRSMKVGNAHLASMVNTLVLAYASAALPLLILFALYQEPWYLTINRELIAEEIVRTLVGSLGLMLAVPLTSAIASWAAPRLAAQESELVEA